MSDQDQKNGQANPNPGDGGDKNINLEDYVPKDEFSKQIGAKESEVSSLKRSLEEAQEKLLDPNYLRYLADKGKTANDDTKTNNQSAQTGQPSKEMTDRIQNVELALSNIAAVLELNEVRSKFSDFDEHRDKIETLIKGSGNNLSFEQAYHIVKSQLPENKGKPDDKKTEDAKNALKGSEKPGQYTFDQQTQDKEFKGTEDATADAVQQIRDKYGISGDAL